MKHGDCIGFVPEFPAAQVEVLDPLHAGIVAHLMSKRLGDAVDLIVVAPLREGQQLRLEVRASRLATSCQRWTAASTYSGSISRP